MMISFSRYDEKHLRSICYDERFMPYHWGICNTPFHVDSATFFF